MSYNITQYPYSMNRYNLYQNNTDTISNGLSTPVQQPIATTANFKGQLATSPDTVSFSATNQIQGEPKQGLSTGAKWGIGTLAVASLGILAYILTKGKVGTKQLAEHIEFQPAKTVEEAKKFAQDKLKMIYIDYEHANLDMLNTVNEMCAKNMKQGKVFDVIHFENRGACNIEHPLAFSSISDGEHTARVLRINTDYIDKFDDLIKYVFKHDDGIDINKIIKKNADGTYSVVNQEYHSTHLDKLIEKLNSYNSKSTYKDKLEIYDGFSELSANYHNILDGKNTMNDFSFDGGFIHEAGHSLHYNSNPTIYNALLNSNNELIREFKGADKQQIAKKVSNYAKTEPLEFVAEVYKGVQRGKTFDEDVMTLYKKYGGPIIS